VPNLKTISLAILELLAFNAPNFTGSRDPGHARFQKLFSGGHVGTFENFSRCHIRTNPGSMHAKLKSILSAIMELLAFHGQKPWVT